jgi:hypothetical protein
VALVSLEVVGVQEAAQILNVEVPRISKWILEDREREEARALGAAGIAEIEDAKKRKRFEAALRRGERLPPMVARPKATPLWRVEDIEVLRDHGEWKASLTRSGRRPRCLPLLGLHEVSLELAALGGEKPLDKSQIGRWRRKGQFPVPVVEKREHNTPWSPGAGIGATPLWMREDIIAFRDARLARRRPVAA